VLHLGLVEEHHDELFAARLVVDDQRLVFNIRPEAATVDFHRCLFKRKIKKVRGENQQKVNLSSACKEGHHRNSASSHTHTQDHPQWR